MLNLFCQLFKKKIAFNIVQGDITKLGYDVVVNAANKELRAGGGVCGSIYRAAGVQLNMYTDTMEPIETGEATTTPGFNCSKFIVHAVGPIFNPDVHIVKQNALLASAYKAALKEASWVSYCPGDRAATTTLAFPLISTGIYGYPKDEAVKVAIQTIKAFVDSKPKTKLTQIDIVCFTEEDYLFTKEVYNSLK